MRLKGDVARDDSHNEFLHNTAFQHCCHIVSNVYNIVPTLQHCAVLKTVLVNRSVRGVGNRPIPIVLAKCWKVAHWNAKKLLKNCQKSQKLLPKFQKLLPKFLAIFI